MLGCDVCGQDVEMVLCELFKSVEVSDRGDKSTHAAEPASVTSSASYRKQLTVEELFKGESIILLLRVETGTLISSKRWGVNYWVSTEYCTWNYLLLTFHTARV